MKKDEKGKCRGCGKQVGEAYKYCAACNATAHTDAATELKQINWNLGKISQTMEQMLEVIRNK